MPKREPIEVPVAAPDDVWGYAARIMSRVFPMYPCEKEKESQRFKDPFPMYSYNRISPMFWRQFAGALFKRGYSEEQVEMVMKSKNIRWSLDAGLDFSDIIDEMLKDGLADRAIAEY